MQNRQKLHTKIRHRVTGTAERPRLAVYRSLNNLFAQLIDDNNAKTIGSASSLKLKGSRSSKAKAVGEEIASIAKELKIKAAVFDRGGFGYKGVIKIVAEAAREKGLEI
ncbi:MAG TPA: 50S ribosomal protein L18 [Candidatus Saccharimonadales bacterium]|nr:50S ribosomal protein L18 [Candidatus Saccharimonadales bacterium]